MFRIGKICHRKHSSFTQNKPALFTKRFCVWSNELSYYIELVNINNIITLLLYHYTVCHPRRPISYYVQMSCNETVNSQHKAHVFFWNCDGNGLMSRPTITQLKPRGDPPQSSCTTSGSPIETFKVVIGKYVAFWFYVIYTTLKNRQCKCLGNAFKANVVFNAADKSDNWSTGL